MKGRKLLRDLDLSTMYGMRERGMTNKQIAAALDISVSSVYQHIGRMSEAVKHAEVQHKPCPVSFRERVEKMVPVDREERAEQPLVVADCAQSAPVTPSPVEEPKKKESPLSLIKEYRVMQLKGNVCEYRVDTGAKTVDMVEGGLVTGVLDLELLDAFMEELAHVRELIS